MIDDTRVLGSVTVSSKVIEEVTNQVKDITDYKEKIEEYFTANITDLLDVILYGAITLVSLFCGSMCTSEVPRVIAPYKITSTRSVIFAVKYSSIFSL
jgi:hypothetical protein